MTFKVAAEYTNSQYDQANTIEILIFTIVMLYNLLLVEGAEISLSRENEN